jgi:nucleotide-binding universal stress UspA family protein
MTTKHFEWLLVPTDGSPGASAAAGVAALLAREVGASIDVLTVVDTSPLADAYGDPSFRAERIAAIHAKARQDAAAFADRHFAGIHQVRVHVRDGDTFLEILRAAKELESDVIVMGTHGRTGLQHLLIGSVAEKVVRKSPIPVMTVRGAD